MSKSKTTIYDVANYLGISIATVNRALNNKPEVSEETKAKVRLAAKKLNYRPSKTASTLNRQPKKVAILMSLVNAEFVNEVKKGIEDALDELEDFNFSGEIIGIESGFHQKECIQKMYECAKSGFDAIIVYDQQNTGPVKMAMEDIAETYGVKFAAGLTEINCPANLVNLQIDGKLAGRMAAELLNDCLLEGDKVAMVTGFSSNIEHNATIQGFSEQIKLSKIVCTGIYEHNDDSEMAEWVAEKIIKSTPDIKGIFIGTAKSIAFCRKIEELGYKGKVKIIAADMFEELSELMDEGLVMASVFKSPYKMGYKLVKEMFEHMVYGKEIEERYQYIEPRILFNSNKTGYLHRSKAMQLEG